MPTLPLARTSWFVPAIKPLVGKVRAPLIVEPAAATYVDGVTVEATVIVPAALVTVIALPAVNVDKE